MKKYGPVSLAVYLGFSVIDLSLTMTAIHLCGSEKVLRLEHYVKTEAAKLFGRSPPPPLSDSQLHQEPSWTSIFVLAYGIHKTILLPVRLSLTMATTPAIARRLVRYGWIKPIPKSKPPTSSL
ncbi:hypothetical protein DM01DRAFT_1293676 [Hesseltinella vesiculosa]|uniref:DUF1279 domain-containing protein n=1 Tax=Hesseltinella vesiculosa TaxID=101127 RepID=A0A1X2G6L5_9FUNG|nr:hypothetical protein DM01DRAFT_1293676 [Hesseltinella vesiculosa]